MIVSIKIIILIILLHTLVYSDVVIGNGNVERLSDPVTKDINCQNYTILNGGLLDTSSGGILREVTQLKINGQWKFGTGQIKELGAWINNGTVYVKPTQTGTIPNLEFTTLCGPISIKGTSDTDGDGISDADEGDNAVALGHGIALDQDSDGVYNFLDADSDNDSITDVIEGGNDIDTDEDGIPDYLDNNNNLASIKITKIGTFNDENGNTYADIGESIVYEFNITNTGDVNLYDIGIEDNNALVFGSNIDILVAGESNSMTFTARHILTLEDIVNGKVLNQATVSAKDNLGLEVNNISDDPTNTTGEHDITDTYISVEKPVAIDNNVSTHLGGIVEIDVIGNDNSGFFDLNVSSIRLIDPQTGERVLHLVVSNEGIWNVNPITGKITFTPISAYVGDPTPIEYSVEDIHGTEVTAYIYLEYTPVAHNDTKEALVGNVVTVEVLSNDTHTSQTFVVDSIVITDENGTVIGEAGKELVVEGEGIWIVHDNGTITFEPEVGFTSNPTAIWYKLQDTRGDFTNIAKINIEYRKVTPTPTPTPTQIPTPIVGDSDIVATDNLNIVVTSYRPKVIDVLGNGDSFGSEGACKLSFTQAVYGTVDVDDAGTPNTPEDDMLIYTLIDNLNQKSDSFEYTITDCVGNSDSAFVTLDISCIGPDSSDSVGALGKLSILFMIMMTTIIGMLFIRDEKI